ncbi:site-specific integrase [Mesorhizobium sp. 10J20-29]
MDTFGTCLDHNALGGQEAQPFERDWRVQISRLEGAYSPHTLRSYRSDFETFERWCENNGHGFLPATPEIVAAYIASIAPGYATSTIKRKLCGIRKIHRLCRLDNPIDTEDVSIAVRRVRRSKLSRPKQALGLTEDLREIVLQASDTDLVGLRNRAMIAVAYDTLCRRSELVALRVEDMQESARGKPIMLVRRAKNDPFGSGRTASLSTAGLQALRRWLNAAEIHEGPLFRPIYHGSVVPRSLNPYTVARVLKSMAKKAGLDSDAVRQLSGHSMRVGAAQDLMSNGFGMLTIMRAGGWKSINVVARYVENADLHIWD